MHGTNIFIYLKNDRYIYIYIYIYILYVHTTLFYNCSLIRLTSPNLNYLIGSGAILLYLAIIVTVLPATSAVFASVLCNLGVWLTGFGYSLCYGTILVKMWRVYYIFSNPSAQKKAVHFAGLISILYAINVY